MIHAHSLGRAAGLFPDRAALWSGDRWLTFAELDHRVAGIAGALGRHGFGPGDRLAVLMPNGPDYLELVYACVRLGVIVVPLNVRLSVVELDRILADASPLGLIRHSSLPVPTTPLAWQAVLDQEQLDLGIDGSRSAPINDPDAVLALIYTSGTTGHPKGVVVTHANILANVEHLDYWMPHQDGAVHLHAAPLFHIADFPVMFAAPAFGSAQITISRFTPQDFCQTVEHARVSRTVLVPTMINLLTQFPELEKYNLTSLEEIAYGGSPMAPELIRRTREVLPGIRLVQGYGLSETGFLTALRDDEHVGRRLTSCGRPAPGIEVRVVDGSGAVVKAGEAGELVARGANVMRGYWNSPTNTAQAFLDCWFRTGDVGYRDADGFFYILDRLKDMIVTGGENVYSGEVEAVIYQHPAVLEAAVFGIPDPKWGELVAACVVLKPGKALSGDELIDHCRASLANYKVPRRVEFSETELPKSETGKILKRVLREHFWDHQERAVS
jgi:acyl-CoA synthetase (AMP-forming)/AMP-acid ligase II